MTLVHIAKTPSELGAQAQTGPPAVYTRGRRREKALDAADDPTVTRERQLLDDLDAVARETINTRCTNA